MQRISVLNGDSITTTDAGHKGCRALELEQLLQGVVEQLIPFVRSADCEIEAHKSNVPLSSSALLDYHPPGELASLVSPSLAISAEPSGRDGLLSTLESILKYSVNTSAPGFLDKLYAAPVPPGIAADLILSVLNTNLHVYQVSPVLTLIEKHVTKSLASLFGLIGPRAGGINVQGGSASNTTSIVIARNTLFPQTKIHGNTATHNGSPLHLVLFTSAHGHYSIEKAAQQCGLGSEAVIPVPVDPVSGAMVPSELGKLVIRAKAQGQTPFYVNATAGTTVLGSFDPFHDISIVAKRHNLWLHIDGAWGGSVVFSKRLRAEKLQGCELADSIAVNPHKMLGVPVTCSFLLGRDLRTFHRANTLRAGYLFHDNEENDDDTGSLKNEHGLENEMDEDDEGWEEPYDLADLTLQCGRRGDSLKLFLAWQYYGTKGYAEKVENAHRVAAHMAALVARNPNLVLVSQNPPPCLQVCFYYAPHRKSLFGSESTQLKVPGVDEAADRDCFVGKYNSKVTERITKALVARGFMVDFSPALEGQERTGKFFRVVVNIQTVRETVERLVEEIVRIGRDVESDFRDRL